MTAALILAGGQGSRLGGMDKAFVLLNGKPLIAHLLNLLSPQASAIAISANGNSARFASYGLPVLPDGNLHGKGPLAGVAAGLAWAQPMGFASLLTIPVDTPFIPDNLMERLSPAPSVAAWQGRQHHLVAHWQVKFLLKLRGFLAAPGAYKVRDALSLCGATQMPFDNALEDPFLNINTADDLRTAEIRMA